MELATELESLEAVTALAKDTVKKDEEKVAKKKKKKG